MNHNNKWTTLAEAIAQIPDGSVIALGGNVMHRCPSEAVRELVRQNKKNLHIVKTAGAYDVDYLCAKGAVRKVSAGFISYETQFGLARFYRKAVESGTVEADEHACYTIISALRAASYGIGFMPVRGLKGTELLNVNPNFKPVTDPFTGEIIWAVKALRPDYAIIHVQEADEDGNCRITGPKYEDALLARAAKNVIVTCEGKINGEFFLKEPSLVDIPGFLVTKVILCKNGAWPASCAARYDIDEKAVRSFIDGGGV